ncbi:MAG: hypothetical protein WC473_03460 [Patescibacteria group bacterium]|jgi:hypothetical protein
MGKLPFIEPERCGQCGRLTRIYDSKNQVCFNCYHNLSPFAKKKQGSDGQPVVVPPTSNVLNVRI